MCKKFINSAATVNQIRSEKAVAVSAAHPQSLYNNIVSIKRRRGRPAYINAHTFLRRTGYIGPKGGGHEPGELD